MTFDPLLPRPGAGRRWSSCGGDRALWVWSGAAPSTRSVVTRWSAMGLLLVVVAADPAIGGGQAAVKRSDANVLFVVDTTGSMAAQDYDGGEPRLAGVRHDIAAARRRVPRRPLRAGDVQLEDPRDRPVDDRPRWRSTRRRSCCARSGRLYAQGTRLDEPLPTMRRRAPPRRSRSAATTSCSSCPTASRPSSRRRNRSSASTTSSPAARCSATARRKAPGCTCTSATTRARAVHPPTTRPAPTPCRGSTRRTSPGSPTSWASATSTARRPTTSATSPATAAGQAGTVYAGERDTVRRLYWLPAFGLIALVLWQLARTALEIVDDRRALGARSPEGAT